MSSEKFSLGRVRCPDRYGTHNMVYTEWGDQHNPEVLVCVHGLTRNGRDFDFLAEKMASRYRIICPDVVGRGKSDWLADKSLYGIPQYVNDMLVLLARLNVDQVFWLGTSMGGLIGMQLASLADSPIKKLVLNDVGPLITRTALQRIAAYVGQKQSWESFEAAEDYLKTISAPFGPLTALQWRMLSQHSFVKDEEGRWRFGYDPGIGMAFRSDYLKDDVDLWPVYERIQCPVMAIRGAESDLLERQVWQSMGQRGPKTRCVEIPGVGHAPMFLSDPEVTLLEQFCQHLNCPGI